MASPTTFRSPYVLRLELVRDTITSHTKLGDKEASDLAEHVLRGIEFDSREDSLNLRRSRIS